MEDIRAFELKLEGKPVIPIYFLHSKTYIAELWHGESQTAQEFAAPEDKLEAIRAIHKLITDHNCNEHHGKEFANTLNLAVLNRDGWVEAAIQAKDEGLELYFVETNAPRGTFVRRDVDSYLINEARQEIYIRNTYRETEYVLDHGTAGIYCVMQSHRVATAEAMPTVMLALDNPMREEKQILNIIGQPEGNLAELMKNGRKYFLEFG